MRRRRWCRAVWEEAGSSLIVTLVLITVVTALIGAVLTVQEAQYRFIRRDAHRLQARYAAEAGVYVAMDRLQQNPFWQASDVRLALPEGQASRVTVERFGGFLFIRSEARYRRSRSTVRALVGEVPPAAFHHAVLLWDTASSLHVAGHTRITGDVVVGRRGVRESTFKRRRFTGRIDGRIHKVPGLSAPFFDGTFLEGAVDGLEQHLRRPSSSPPPVREARPRARQLPSGNPVWVADRSLRLTPADSLLLRGPITIVARGDLTLEGPLHYASGSAFVAGRTLHLVGGVTGSEAVFLGRAGVEIGDAVRCSGQFFSRTYIRVGQGATLRYPSVLYVTGEAAEEGGGITVADGAGVDGTVVHPPLDPRPRVPQGRIVVEPGAQVRGALFNGLETEFHGTLYGALLTRQLYFYESPTSYVNWMKDAVVDAYERPVTFVLPLRFSPAPRLAVVNWEAAVDEPRPPL